MAPLKDIDVFSTQNTIQTSYISLNYFPDIAPQPNNDGFGFIDATTRSAMGLRPKSAQH